MIEKGYELFFGNSLDILKTFKDDSIDCLMTDPPFGLVTDTDIMVVLDILKECRRICKRMVILMDYRNFWKVDALFSDIKIGELIWEYGWVSGGRAKVKSGWFPTHNTIGLYGNKHDFCFLNGSIIKRQPGFSSPRQCSFAHKTGHPYEKPVALMNYLIEGSTKLNETCLDPFMGSGSTGISCLNLHRKFIGIEIDENYFKVAKERIEKHSTTKRLF